MDRLGEPTTYLAGRVLLLAVLFAGVGWTPCVHAQGPAEASAGKEGAVLIDPETTWGQWDGWGASLCWWAKAFGDREDLADLFFTAGQVEVEGQLLPGLGLNIVRYNAGACSWNTIGSAAMNASPHIPPHRQMEGFWLDGRSTNPDSPGWDWSVDANQRGMLLKARDRGADHFELFSNSPMWWMCENRNPSGAGNGKDNLKPGHYRDFAVYLATIARYAQDEWGIAFTSVEPFNEPSAKWWKASNNQEGCHFSFEAQAAVIGMLRREMDRRGLRDLPIAASDENQYDEAVRTWRSFGEMTKAQVGQVNVHGYQKHKGRRDLLYKAVAGKRLWNSEYGEGDPVGLELARNLHLDFQHLHPTAWCYWQPLDGGGWGLIQADLAEKAIGPVNPKYFVLAHYTRHIRPGMTILHSGDPHSVAAYDAEARKFVIVTANFGHARAVAFDLSRFAAVDGPISRWVTTPRGESRYEPGPDIALVGKGFECELPADSVQTFEVRNVVWEGALP